MTLLSFPHESFLGVSHALDLYGDSCFQQRRRRHGKAAVEFLRRLGTVYVRAQTCNTLSLYAALLLIPRVYCYCCVQMHLEHTTYVHSFHIFISSIFLIVVVDCRPFATHIIQRSPPLCFQEISDYYTIELVHCKKSNSKRTAHSLKRASEKSKQNLDLRLTVYPY
jgi:hypothetical protein